MTLYLLRHGVAEQVAAGGTDRDRRLTGRGRARMRRAASGLARLIDRLDILYTSPYPRAAETAAIVAAALPHAPKPRELDALVPDSSPLDALRSLRSLAKAQHLMLVGHEPLLSHLASLLLTGSVDGASVMLKKGGCVAVTIRTLAPRAAVLDWVATPRMLRKLARGATHS
jgi:phosphohistidine phosphatase